jgi:hypothetical protein
VILIVSYIGIPWRIGPLEMLMVPQTTIKFIALYGNLRFVIVFAVLCYVAVSGYLK